MNAIVARTSAANDESSVMLAASGLGKRVSLPSGELVILDDVDLSIRSG